jgi:cell division protein FtsX
MSNARIALFGVVAVVLGIICVELFFVYSTAKHAAEVAKEVNTTINTTIDVSKKLKDQIEQSEVADKAKDKWNKVFKKEPTE